MFQKCQYYVQSRVDVNKTKLQSLIRCSLKKVTKDVQRMTKRKKIKIKMTKDKAICKYHQWYPKFLWYVLHFLPIFERHFGCHKKASIVFCFQTFAVQYKISAGWNIMKWYSDIIGGSTYVLTLTLLYLAILSLTIFFYKFSELELSVKSMKHLNLWGWLWYSLRQHIYQPWQGQAQFKFWQDFLGHFFTKCPKVQKHKY